jgi:DNA-binding response OmpR family regulator
MGAADRILLIDLDADAALLCRVYLRRAGYVVVDEDASPDLVLLGAGIERPGAYTRWKHVPVIALIGRAREDDQLVALQAGAADLLATPFHPDALVGVVRTTLSRTGPQRVQHRDEEIARISLLRRL